MKEGYIMKQYQSATVDFIGISRQDILTDSVTEPLGKIGIEQIGEGVTLIWKQ